MSVYHRNFEYGCYVSGVAGWLGIFAECFSGILKFSLSYEVNAW